MFSLTSKIGEFFFKWTFCIRNNLTKILLTVISFVTNMSTQNKLDRKIIIGLILATTLPFLSLFSNILEVVPIADFELFWARLVFITASVAGLIGAILLMWSFLLASKSLISLVTPDVVWVLKVHKWIGKYGLLLVLVHPILTMISYFENIAWIFVPDLSSNTQIGVTIGRVAFILVLYIY